MTVVSQLGIASPILGVERDGRGNLTLPAVAVGEQALLVVVKLLARFGGELEVRALDDGIHRTGLLAQSAVNALHHVDVVAGGAARAIVAPWTGLDGDGLGRTNCLAQLASDAALLPVGIAPQRMLAAEAGREWSFFEGVVERRLRLKEVAHGQEQRRHELPEKQRSDNLSKSHAEILWREFEDMEHSGHRHHHDE